MQHELADLYYYLESQRIRHPIKGVIPFKLHSYQMLMLDAIHTYDRLLIIKGRQIGASEILAGYIAWRFNRTGKTAVINSIKHVCTEELFKRVKWFEPEYPKLVTDDRGIRADLYVYDEWNYNQCCGKPYDHTRFLRPGKHIITGTVDQQNKLYNLYVELTGRENPYRVMWFPVMWCPEAWPKDKVRLCKPMFEPKQWLSEMECQWT